MAFTKKTWTDRVAEYINRRVLNKTDGTQEVVTVERSEGDVSVEGDAFNAANMNDLEDRIEEAIDDLKTYLTERLKGLTIGYSSDHVVVKIDKAILIFGYSIKSYSAWEGIFTIGTDPEYFPSVAVRNGSFELTTDGLFRVTSNVSAGVAYSIFYTVS